MKRKSVELKVKNELEELRKEKEYAKKYLSFYDNEFNDIDDEKINRRSKYKDTHYIRNRSCSLEKSIERNIKSILKPSFKCLSSKKNYNSNESIYSNVDPKVKCWNCSCVKDKKIY
jgi:hypothetical protein